jgi:hypothetical protein
MKRRLLASPRLRGSEVQVLRLAGLLFLGLLGVLGIRAYFQNAPNTKPAPMRLPGADSVGTCDPGAFRGMRPRSDDTMTLPRVGFRWIWVPDSAMAATSPGPVKFRVHLVSCDGAHEVTRQVTESRAQVNLREEFPTGRCQWWIEALAPGRPPIRSGRETFLLER